VTTAGFLAFAGLAGLSMTGTVESGLPHLETPGRLLLTIAIKPVPDDSIAAEQWRATLRPEDNGWRIEQPGLRRKCSRGPDSGNWEPFICP